MKKLEIINGVIFWGTLVWAGIEYGWKLPVILLLFMVSTFLQLNINKSK